MNDTQKLIAAHRTVRAFEPTPVSEETIERCVRAARQAATSSNVQAYCLLQVTDPAERARLRELSGDQSQVEESGAFFVLCADERRHALIASDAGSSPARNFESFLVAVIDATLFVQNLVLAFESEGLGTCYIGGLRTHIQEVDALLELPNGVYPLFGLCVGTPAGDPGTRPRLDPRALWFEGRYPDDDRTREWIAEHDARAAEYYAERGAAGRSWSAGLLRKITTHLRAGLQSFYASKGAGVDRPAE